jgi:hypothetical protein
MNALGLQLQLQYHCFINACSLVSLSVVSFADGFAPFSKTSSSDGRHQKSSIGGQTPATSLKEQKYIHTYIHWKQPMHWSMDALER